MSKINARQATAASHADGHAIVLAGPGTGKTSTLVARHSWLRSRGTDAGAICVLTFTQKAAEELRERLGGHVPQSAWIGTFHGMCLRLLKRFSSEAGLLKSFRVMDPSAQRELLASAGIVWDSDDGDLVDIIGRWKDSLTTPDEADAAAARAGNPVLRAAAAHYRTYEEELERSGDLDFADLVTRSLAILRQSSEVAGFIGARLPHVLVDEFQDVNRSQVELLQAMAACGASIWAVADDDQALYGWRGGDVRYTVDFPRHFPGAARYTLETNYRCDPAIVAAANALIAKNARRVPKALKPSREHRKGTSVRIRSFATEKDEAEWIAGEIARFATGGANVSRVAVLFRTASVTPAIQQALESRQIEFSLSGTQSFWDLPEVMAVGEVLLAVETGEDGRAARFRGGRDLVQTMKGSKPPQAAPAAGRLVAEQPPGGVSAERASAWSDSAEAAALLAARFASAGDFLAHVSLMSGSAASRSKAKGESGVAVSTIHSSKGLEWSHVFVAGCEASLMPHAKAEDREEERRLLYVALTRSTGSVDVTWSRQRFGRSQAPSPFLSEISEAPKGAVTWVGRDSRPGTRVAGLQERPSSEGIRDDGKPAVYRRRGGRSLIPPEDR